MPEMRVSPDGESIAIRGENAEDAYNAWAVMNRRHGGHWSASSEVANWLPLAPVGQAPVEAIATPGGSASPPEQG
jgi:hypothetical protein